ncbi:nitrogenase iron-molybdenum cofactor biosynthesis protein NifN [Parafrankia colletiae]|uniref:Nitrogenase iron-molybdenum cofactor biosynthesis protein NifN n=1 Tax=Parafrankia colletiae TaxID=573497 RepID=A0A1S1QTR1_9ACTN|nr:nitrogenase iron-molybdenum cofactor biosynthesis protein NifN [Parafrankia colletiae]MCK9902378.1 nitrogenase iron-molybdenum cofactor biosynthesis protein NifN [Frankia sp. Cpl3]OHV35794.1 nitrogenase iron-molybdenum cofactor biosynthesis protein NifN [Parafrankia colletiae]
MARVVTTTRRAGLDPLKFSQPLGGALVFLGLAGAMPVMHGSKGCASFAKALLTRHFNEPIPLQTTGITEVTAVLGSGEELVVHLDAIRAKQRPEIIGLLTTGVTEVSGEDVAGQMRQYIAMMEHTTPEGAPLIVRVSTPDFIGGLSDGWSAALRALVSAVPFDGPDADDARRGSGSGSGEDTVAVLVGPSLTAADLDELCALIRGFGLAPVLVPDLSGSLDGHLAPSWQPTTTGGTGLAALRRLDRAGLVITVGATAAEAGVGLAARTDADLVHFDHLSGLRAVDALVTELMARSGRGPTHEVRRARARLADGLLDSHFGLGGARIALAMEPEALVAVGSLLHDVGAEIVAAVSPTDAPVLATAPWDEIVIGDLIDLEERAVDGGAELLIGSSHVRAVADRIGAPHLPVGFPIYDRLGATLRTTAGYAGSLRLLVDAANRLLDHHHDTDHRMDPHRDHHAERRDVSQHRIDPFDELDVLCQEPSC